MDNLLHTCKLVMILTPCMWVLYIFIMFLLFCYTEKNKKHIPKQLQSMVDQARLFIPTYTYMCVFSFVTTLTMYITLKILN